MAIFEIHFRRLRLPRDAVAMKITVVFSEHQHDGLADANERSEQSR
ncbi:hypothetical protein [Burkholderia multivorans]|nr:hypothetical protein [Burkholderia multivorans]MCO1380737.1 hypothetical protein [Burkholderia multivorans]MCO1400851.1 hypothetical protein [Burkholderia multivorans]UQO77410.1 hypothetical protein L0Z12_16680 [Burkholderia multivorans]